MNTKTVDARGLEPPEPFERAMEAIADLPAGGQFILLIDRMPHPLLRILERDGYRHDAGFRDDGAVEILISRP
jgi:TusA-related sulfurtransferase